MPRYYIRKWVEVSQDEFVKEERDAGFIPKPGCGPVATTGFGIHKPTEEWKGDIDGRVEPDSDFAEIKDGS